MTSDYTFHDLPDEIHEYIFRKLDFKTVLKFRAVCKSFYDIAAQFNTVLDMGVHKGIWRRELAAVFPNLKELVLSDEWVHHEYSALVWKQIAEAHPNLKVLRAPNVTGIHEGLKHIANLTNLRVLDVSSSKNCSYNGLADILNACTRLHTLLMSDYGHYDRYSMVAPDKLMNALVLHPKLRVLDISYCSFVTPEFVTSLLNKPTLEDLRIRRCHLDFRIFEEGRYLKNLDIKSGIIRDHELEGIIRGCARLTGLDVSDTRLSEEGLLQLSAVTQLTSLNIKSQTGRVSAATTTKICASLKELRTLHVDNVDDDTLRVLAGCPYLTVLKAENAFRASERAVVELAKKCVHLVELVLSNAMVGDEAYFAIAENCHNMQVLVVRPQGATLTDRGVQRLARGCTKLRVLELKGAVAITDISIKALLLLCRELICLQLQGCPNITPKCVKKIKKRGIAVIAGSPARGDDSLYDFGYEEHEELRRMSRRKCVLM